MQLRYYGGVGWGWRRELVTGNGTEQRHNKVRIGGAGVKQLDRRAGVINGIMS